MAHAGGVEQRADLVEVRAVLGVEAVEQQRRVAHHLAHCAIAGVERAQGVLVDPLAHVLAQPVLVRV